MLIGPIAPETLDAFQRAGWADGSQAGEKLYRLTELAEPFYLRAEIRLLLETSESGFVLGRVRVGNNALGFEGGETDQRLRLLGVQDGSIA